jgi:acetyltransferase-like isoleucine patch superfamily enzyme
MGIKVGRHCRLGKGAAATLGWANGKPGTVTVGDRVRLERGVLLEGRGGLIDIASDVFLGPYTVVYGHGGVTIGKDTLIAMHCRILSSDHDLPAPGSPGRVRDLPDVRKSTAIGEDVWLGAGVTVLGGVTIGDGCVVGAGAVVTRDLPPQSVALGVPARVVKMRGEQP